ncbi:Replication initiator protein A (plasmid) [Deinococcus actinosclerus]|nr:Replication initiator protein A [Deinococcus actinosclerus]
MTKPRRNSFDDLNWGRLNLISAQDQIGELNTWKVTYPYGERMVRVSCRALPELGVPHGIDNDVSSALIDYYLSLGMPDDGEMTLAVSELMQIAGFHRNGKYREMLMTSLDRLHTTSYEIAGGWRDHPNRRWTTARFHFIELLEYTHQGQSGQFDDRSTLRVRLAEPLVASLRSGFTKPLNIEFMQSLSRPRTRIIFRLLDAMRYNPEDPDDVVDEFDVGLTEWADLCKLPSARPDSIRRALEGPHEELVRRGYLRAVLVEGRGRAQRLRFQFASEFTPVSPALLNRLRSHGITDGVSRQLARQYTHSVLLGRIDQFERLVRSGELTVRKTAAHALVHLIRNSDQYPDGGRRPGRVPAAPTQVKERPAAPEPVLPTWGEELAGMTPDEAATFTVKRVSLLFSKRFTLIELDQLRHEVLRGRLDPAQLLTEAHLRLARIEAQQFVDDLKTCLQQAANARPVEELT